MSSDATPHDADADVLRVAAVQVPLRLDSSSPLEAARRAERLMRQAATDTPDGIDLFVLPELCPIGYSEHTFANYLPCGDGEDDAVYRMNNDIEHLFANFAREYDAFVSFGVVGEKEEGSAALTIRQIVLNGKGDVCAQYDKIHLCDYGDCAETRFFSPGNQPCSFDCRGFRVGLIICADMRNPTLCRELAARHKVDVIVQPAAFSRDISFRTWRSFRETRAVENSVYFVGVNYSGEYYGETSFVEPWVDHEHEPRLMGTDEGVLVGMIERRTLSRVRKEMPYYRQLQNEDRDENTAILEGNASGKCCGGAAN